MQREHSLNRRVVAHRILGVALTLAACEADDGAPSLDGTGESGDDAGTAVPNGSECGPNWYAIDGDPVSQSAGQPEFLGGSLAEPVAFLEFAGPPTPAREYPRPLADPSFAQLSFEQFVSLYAVPAGPGQWFVDGDQAISDDGLLLLYENLHAEASYHEEEGAVPVAANYHAGGFDSTWSAGEKLSLTWCIGTIWPGPNTNPEVHQEHLERALVTMEWATRAWERASDINFVHLSEFDSPASSGSGMCQPGENGIDFRVRTGSDCIGACGGRAYSEALPYNEFVEPDAVEGTAEISLGLQRFFSSEKEARINALHELGHVMGFTHEHLQFEQAESACAQASIEWRGVTPPDSDSVMGYDICDGITTNAPVLSGWDRLGAYYGYNWTHRRALMMGAASQVDDYSYDGTGRTGILWAKSRSEEMEVWTSVGGAGQPVDFAVELACASGAPPPCDTGFDPEGRVRPVNAFLSGTAGDLDVLFQGPGPMLEDSILINNSGEFDPWEINLDSFNIAVVGSFGPGIEDQILLHQPGPAEDLLLVVDDSGPMVIPMNYAGYAYPLAGRYRGFGGGGNDILWYQPRSNEFSVWQWNTFDPFTFFDLGVTDASNLGLQTGVEYVPIMGDFDGDDRTDLFWYSAGANTDFMWWSESNQDAVLFEVAQAEVHEDYRPFVGDFDGNGSDDILWFSPSGEAVNVGSKIWYFGEDRSFESAQVSTNRDYSPYVADFDGDGCSDILWYQPSAPGRESPVWRCIPAQRDFECDDAVTPPVGGYPVGFGGAY